MGDKRTPKRILRLKPIGTRTRGRPRKTWIAGTEEFMQLMGVRRWRKQCELKAEWKKSMRKPKPTVGCNDSKRRFDYYRTQIFKNLVTKAVEFILFVVPNVKWMSFLFDLTKFSRLISFHPN
jgi:hypothetical protein